MNQHQGQNRNKRSQGNSNQRRRRGGQRPQQQRDNTPRGPIMTALGESTYEAVFDHGTEGYGVWFDGVVREDPMYRQHWKGNRPIFVQIEEDRIVITRELEGRGGDSDVVADIGNSIEEAVVEAAQEILSSAGEADSADSGGAESPSQTTASAAPLSPAGVDAPEDPVEPEEPSDEPSGEAKVFTPEEAASLFLPADEGGDDAAPVKKRTPRAKKKPADDE